jgi:hypothetical protein
MSFVIVSKSLKKRRRRKETVNKNACGGQAKKFSLLRSG